MAPVCESMGKMKRDSGSQARGGCPGRLIKELMKLLSHTHTHTHTHTPTPDTARRDTDNS